MHYAHFQEMSWNMSTVQRSGGGAAGPSRSRPPPFRPSVVCAQAPQLLLVTRQARGLARSIHDYLACLTGSSPVTRFPRAVSVCRVGSYVSRYLITPRAKRRRAMCVRVSAPFAVPGRRRRFLAGRGNLLASCHGRGTTPRDKIPSDDDDR